MVSRVLTSFVILLIAACGNPAEPEHSTAPAASEAVERIVFHRGNGADPGTLDPARAEDDSANNILRDLYEGLVRERVDSVIEPGGAISWEISANGREYLFHLRPEAHWSNGDPVVAEDYVVGFRRTVDPATGSSYAGLLGSIVNAGAITAGEQPPQTLGVEALDDHTLRIRLNASTPYFLGLLTLSQTYPIHRASLDEYGDQFTRPGNLISNGAYMLEESIPQAHIRAIRNPSYWDRDNVAIDEVYYYNSEDRSAELKRYRAGELDYTYTIPNTQYDWIQENLPGELHSVPYLSTYYYSFNLHRSPFQDNVKLRQALSMAVDREILARQISGVGAVPAYSFVPPGIMNYASQEYEWKNWPMGKRLEEARRLYQEAGYSEDDPLTFEILYNTSENHKKIAVAIAQMWKQALGVEVTLVNQEWKVFLQTRLKPDAWDVLRFSWVGDYNDANTYAEIMQTENGQNHSGYSNGEYDQLVEAAAVESDADQRRELLEQVERTMLQDYALIPLYFPVTKHIVQPYVKGYQPNIMNRDQTRHYRIEKTAR